nr:hypothetical protein BaRGS_021835 [Batillaria attramentaria]
MLDIKYQEKTSGDVVRVDGRHDTPDRTFRFTDQVLAWLDMSNLVIAMPSLLAITIRDDVPGFTAACKTTSFVAIFTATTSACVLAVIAANRFRKIVQPARSQVKLVLAKKLCAACFVFGACCTIPTVFIFGRDTVTYHGDVQPVNISYCFLQLDDNIPVIITWAVVQGTTFMTITGLLVTLYGFTIRSLRIHDKRISTMRRRPSAVSNVSKTISKKHTLVFIAVTVVFFASYSPYLVTIIILLADRSIERSMNAIAKAFFDIAKLFPLLSNVSNPIIYSFTSEKFRQECKKVFKLRPCRRMLNLERKDSTTVSHELSQSEES